MTSSKLFSMCVSVGVGVCMHGCVCEIVTSFFSVHIACVHVCVRACVRACVCVCVCVLITSFFLSPFSGRWVVDRKDTIKELPV